VRGAGCGVPGAVRGAGCGVLGATYCWVITYPWRPDADQDRAARAHQRGSTEALIDLAAGQGYGALAVTLHDRWYDPSPVLDYARERGVTMIPSVERTIGGRHLLLINAGREVERVFTLEDVRALRADSNVLVVAPHPFYPIPSAIGEELDAHADLIDAVEINAMHVRGIDFNRRAIEWARAHGKPLVANTDLHLLAQLGTSYSLVDADAATPDAICDAIRAGRVEAVSRHLSWPRAAWHFSRMVVGGLRGGRDRELPAGADSRRTERRSERRRH
jgi:predicted metal-dependent phosphoesterase TrpH